MDNTEDLNNNLSEKVNLQQVEILTGKLFIDLVTNIKELFDSIGDPIFIENKNHQLIYINRSFKKLLQEDEAEIIGKRSSDLFQNDGKEYSDYEIKELNKNGGSTIRNSLIRIKDKIYNLSISYSMYNDKKTGQSVMIGIIRDVTDMKKIEDLGTKSTNEMDIVLSTMTEHVVYQDLNHRIIYANKSSAESVGATQESLIGKCCYKVWGDGKDVCSDCPVEKALKSMQIENGYIETPDGRSWMIKGYPVRDDKGNIIGAMEIATNITEKENLKKEIKDTEKKYKFIVENISDIVFQQDKNLNITYISPSVEKVTGYSVNEIMNMSLLDLMTPKSYERGIENFNKYLEIVIKNPDYDIPPLEYEYYTRNGRLIVGEMKIKYIFDKNGGITAIHGVIRDITKRKELENQLILSQKMEAIGKLAGGVAHDFNNLLTVIMGYADIALIQKNIDDKIKFYFEEIKETSVKAADLISRLLIFSKKQPVIPKVIDINELIKNHEKMLSRIIGENIKLETKLDENLKKVKVDPTQIEQVLMNIIVNAKDAMPGGGIIKVETGNIISDEQDCTPYLDMKGNDYIFITVSDTGCGITDEVKKHIFDPFFTTKEKSKGTGLGLFTAYGIIKQSGGNIFVESEKGKGSVFKIYLPTFKGKITEDKKLDNLVIQNLRGESSTILIVEDENSVRDMVSAILKNNEYKIIEASNGLEAMRIIKDKHVDMIISDVVMPIMNGKELYKNIIKEFYDIRFLFMSGYMDDDVLLRDVTDRKVHFIKKPFSSKELLIKLKEILN